MNYHELNPTCRDISSSGFKLCLQFGLCVCSFLSLVEIWERSLELFIFFHQKFAMSIKIVGLAVCENSLSWFSTITALWVLKKMLLQHEWEEKRKCTDAVKSLMLAIVATSSYIHGSPVPIVSSSKSNAALVILKQFGHGKPKLLLDLEICFQSIELSISGWFYDCICTF